MIQDVPSSPNPAAVGNVALILTTSLIGFLLKQQQLEPCEVHQIFEAAQNVYRNSIGAPPFPEWKKHCEANLNLQESDALRLGQRDTL